MIVLMTRFSEVSTTSVTTSVTTPVATPTPYFQSLGVVEPVYNLNAHLTMQAIQNQQYLQYFQQLQQRQFLIPSIQQMRHSLFFAAPTSFAPTPTRGVEEFVPSTKPAV